jgi:hypothetical protein
MTARLRIAATARADSRPSGATTGDRAPASTLREATEAYFEAQARLWDQTCTAQARQGREDWARVDRAQLNVDLAYGELLSVRRREADR